MTPPPRRLVGCVTLTIAAVAAVAARQSPDPQSSFRSATDYVRVDVYASRNGTPVTDLQREDFELLEDGKPQTIDSFERVAITGTRADPRGREPANLAESRAMIDDPRARVFVLFLDTLHVDPVSSRTIANPLIGMLTELIAPDDIVAVMTPRMRAVDLTFGRRTAVVERLLRDEWWSEQIGPAADSVEAQYTFCFPEEAVARDMIARRREEITFDAFEDLVIRLRDVREERKAIMLVSSGWRLFRPNLALAAARSLPIQVEKPGVDPRTGRLGTTDATSVGENQTRKSCLADRARLAAIDHEERFDELMAYANWANVSFYPIDPRGLSPSAGIGQLSVLRRLAQETDGQAVVNTNEIPAALSRISSDLSSYYLLGYRSSSDAQDGKFRRIQVRTRRSGIQIRARRGYLPVRPPTSSPAPGTAASGGGTPAEYVSAAIGALAASARDLPVNIVAAAPAATDGAGAIWVTTEVPAGTSWRDGGDITVRATDPAGRDVGTERTPLPPATRSVTTKLAASSLKPGVYTIRVQARPADGSSPLSESNTVTIRNGIATGAILIRRGVSTGNREQPTADPRIRRNEQLRIEVPGLDASAAARLLDRTGRALAVPLATATRRDSDDSVWRTVQLAAAPLSPGEYLIEVMNVASSQPTLIGFRVVP